MPHSTRSGVTNEECAVAEVEVHVATLAGEEGEGKGVELVASSTEPG